MNRYGRYFRLQPKQETAFVFLAGLCIGSYFSVFHILGHSLQFFPGDFADGRFNMYLLEHAYKYVSGQVDSYWSAPFLFPEKNVITMSDNLLGSAPFYCLFRVSGCDRETSFQLWYATLSLLNFSVCFFCLNNLFRNPYASVLGAFIFAFSMALYSQLPQAQTYARFAIPLAFWAGCRWFRSLELRYLLVLLLAIDYQLYCGLYLGLMLLLPIGAVIIATLVRAGVSRRATLWYVKTFAAAVCVMFLLLPLLIPYVRRAAMSEPYTYDYVSQNLLRPLDYLFACPGSALWKFAETLCADRPNYWAFMVFAGGVATLSFIVFVVVVSVRITRKKIPASDPAVLVFAVALLTYLLFTSFGGFSLYRAVFHLPGFHAMRALQRIVNIELFFMAFAVAYLVNEVPAKYRVCILLLLPLAVYDNFVDANVCARSEKKEAQERLKPLLEQIERVDTGYVISYEPLADDDRNFIQLDGMLAAQELNRKCINGYSANSPIGFSAYWDHPRGDTREWWLQTAGRRDARVAVIH